ncbi:hypothetical protein LR48_Vigan10g073100 [Vigna angularis]|uniref:Uncharacterized protein n=1 Tax=Phaseolus angularis TaxID=3914 RepID=A0A0L9VJD1_PHAAN|nr:hypothetical protein LR48_Vigan10g073100 [Vigna angularis]
MYQQMHRLEKIHLSEDDPVGAFQQLCNIIADELMKVEYDANVFERGSNVPMYLQSQDVRELLRCRQVYRIVSSNIKWVSAPERQFPCRTMPRCPSKGVERQF